MSGTGQSNILWSTPCPQPAAVKGNEEGGQTDSIKPSGNSTLPQLDGIDDDTDGENQENKDDVTSLYYMIKVL